MFKKVNPRQSFPELEEVDFKNWNTEKIKINNLSKTIYFYERDIWFISIGKNIGNEENGKGKDFRRPVLVLKKLNTSLFIGIPLTTTIREGSFFFNFNFKKDKNSCLILAQIRSFDKKRLTEKIGKIDKENFEILKEKLKNLLSL